MRQRGNEYSTCLHSGDTERRSVKGDWKQLDDMSLASLIPDTGPLPGFLADIDQMESLSSRLDLPTATGFVEELPSTLDPSCLDNTSATAASTSGTDFPDSYHLPVHELTLLRAMLRIAERIGCKDQQLWSLEALSPFNRGDATPTNQLPMTWRPTASQLTMPHHPLVDFLPRPGVRDRVLTIFSLPEETRPPQAAGPLALVNLTYAVEDSAEGARIYGGDPYDDGAWEVGQVLFERWWFLFDREIAETSNRWRRMRGAPPLLMKGGSSSSSSAGG